MRITLDSVVSQSHGLASALLDRDLIILNPEGDNYVGLDNFGRRVWDLLAEACVVNDLCRQVTTEYQGDAQEITTDIVDFLNELHADSLIQIKDPADVATR
jgi:uncharacterized protein YaiI (UPF0178 family)